jgi:hypothetical protein
MLTGLGVLPAFADGATLAHVYASDVEEAEFLQASGYVEVPAFLVRVVRPV